MVYSVLYTIRPGIARGNFRQGGAYAASRPSMSSQ